MPRYPRRFGLLLAARRHACAWLPRARSDAWPAQFPARLTSEGHFLVRSADKLPRAQQYCGAPTRRNGLRLPRCR